MDACTACSCLLVLVHPHLDCAFSPVCESGPDNCGAAGGGRCGTPPDTCTSVNATQYCQQLYLPFGSNDILGAPCSSGITQSYTDTAWYLQRQQQCTSDAAAAAAALLLLLLLLLRAPLCCSSPLMVPAAVLARPLSTLQYVDPEGTFRLQVPQGWQQVNLVPGTGK
jgi:hypothetical protein